MYHQSFDALVPYGWSDRVLALFNDVPEQGIQPARIVRVERSSCVGVGPDGHERPLLAATLPAVGDWVAVRDQSIRHVLPRWSAVTRLDELGAGVQVLAADVDLVAITAPADRLSPARVERELAMAYDSGAQPLVLVTKADLDVSGEAENLRARLPGVEVLALSAQRGDGLDELGPHLRPGVTAVLLGPSGAGKSTLANALLGTSRLATGAVRAQDQRGRHTTTSRQLVTLPGGGVLIDTPGLRSLDLAAGTGIDLVFPEIEELARSCRFGDCRHEVEPDCAVRAAAEEGTLDADRLASYRKLQRELAADRRRTDPMARQAELRTWKLRTKAARAAGRTKRR